MSRMNGRKIGAAACGVALVAAALFGSQSASAGPTKSPAAAPVKDLSQELLAMKRAGNTDAQIKAKLGLANVSKPVAAAKKTAAGQVVTPNSSADISMQRPSFYQGGHDTAMYVFSGWRMNRMTDGGSTSTGADGFAIGLSYPVRQAISGALTICPNRFPKGWHCFNAVNYFDITNGGVAWTFNDHQKPKSLYQPYNLQNFSTGDAVFRIQRASAVCIQAYAKYTHTWSKAKVTGVSIGFPMNVSFSVANESSSWVRTSQPGSSVAC